MRFLAVAVLALAAASVAAAADPGVQHMSFGPTVTAYDDFCGTGQAVTETFTANVTVWLDPNQPVQRRNHTESEDVFVVPSTGVTVTTHGAYSFDDVLISGDPSGVNVHQWTFNGAAQVTRVKGQGVIFRDAGHFVVDATWSGPEFQSNLLDVEVVRDDGGHPDFTSDFCTAMVPALGLG
jgi:hypothetical protein